MRFRVLILTSLVFLPFLALAADFPRTLKVGMKGEDVRALQQILNTDSETRVAKTGAGSPGNETDYFGTATKRAVIKFQEKYSSEILAPLGLAQGTGFFGEKTRIKFATMKSTEGRPSDTGNTPKSSILSTMSKEIKSLFASSAEKAIDPEEAEKYYNNFIEIAGRVGFTADEFNNAKKDPELGGTIMMLGDLIDLAVAGTSLNELRPSFLAWGNLSQKIASELKKEETLYPIHESLSGWFGFSAGIAKKFSEDNLSTEEIKSLAVQFNERATEHLSNFEKSVAKLEKTRRFSFIPTAEAVTCGAFAPPNFYHFGGRVIAPVLACALPPVLIGGLIETVATPCGGSFFFSSAVLAVNVARGLNKPTVGSAILGKSTVIPGTCVGPGASPPVWPWEFTVLFFGTSKLP